MYENDGYLGFTFNGYHSSEFGLLVVSDGDRYHQNLFSNFSDTLNSVPGQSGQYYFGTQIGTREFDINCVFDNITTHMRDKIQKWLYPNQVGWLIFDETPYKKYLVKVSQVPSFSYLPFENYSRNKYFNQDILKGEVSISFISFKEYAISNENFTPSDILINRKIDQQTLDSGLLSSKYTKFFTNLNIYTPNFQKSINGLQETGLFSIYNAGNGVATGDFYFWISNYNNNLPIEWPIEIINFYDGQSYIINDFTSEISTYNEHYKIEILGSKQEIWAYGQKQGENYVANENNKKNIGKYYNHYFPKIYQEKPTEILVVSESKNKYNEVEPLFYPVSYLNDKFYPSDSKEVIEFFEGFNKDLSNCIVCTEKNCFEVNQVITPNLIYLDLRETKPVLRAESFVYFIFPNKFKTNNRLIYFTPIYEHTYI